MTYQEFKQEIVNSIKNYLPEKYQTAAICINEIPKNNGVMKSALSVTPAEDGLARQIYLEDAYQYCDNHSMEAVLTETARFIISAMNETVVFDPATVSDFQQAQDRLALRIINRESNQNQLQSIPCHEIENTDLTATFRLNVSVGGADASILVNNSMLENWGVDESTLYEKALQNMQKNDPFIVRSMEDAAGEIMFGTSANVEPNQFPTQLEPYMQYVLTNESRLGGAACMLYPDLLKEIGSKFNSNFFILPSSIHEIIFMKDTGEMNARELQRMVIDINATQVEPEEVLSNQVYCYNHQENTLSMGTTREETAKLMEQISHGGTEVPSDEIQTDMERE